MWPILHENSRSIHVCIYVKLAFRSNGSLHFPLYLISSLKSSNFHDMYFRCYCCHCALFSPRRSLLPFIFSFVFHFSSSIFIFTSIRERWEGGNRNGGVTIWNYFIGSNHSNPLRHFTLTFFLSSIPSHSIKGFLRATLNSGKIECTSNWNRSQLFECSNSRVCDTKFMFHILHVWHNCCF